MLGIDVEIARGDLTVEVALTVGDGERLALFGPSGGGKTTILEVVAGLVTPRRGRVTVNGVALTVAERHTSVVAPWRRQVGLLRQSPALFPHLTVRQNIMYSRRAAADRESALTEVAESLEIGHLLDSRPRGLSGGQAHRVALARLLVAHHLVMLFDEPYTGLDPRLRRLLTNIVREQCRIRRIPSVLVAHELSEAQAFADRLVILDAGRILQDATSVEVIRRPASRRVAELVGYQSFIPTDACRSECFRRLSPPTGAESFAVHPERARSGSASDDGVVLHGVVTRVRPAGAGWEVGLLVADIEVICRVSDDPPGTGSSMTLTVVDPPWFDSTGAALLAADRVGPS